MTEPQNRDEDDVVARVLARTGTAIQAVADQDTRFDGDQLEREERSALRRVSGLSTELADVTEVEYRQLRLERVVLVGIWSSSQEAADVSLRELAALAETAGSEVLAGITQRRAVPDAATYLGSGKAQELAKLVDELGADTVIVDSELAPSQRRGLEDVVKVKVIDRTALILDIFAQHAKSREGKAQVELAQLEYLLPRLRGWGESMSRQAGGQVGSAGAGMGSRGPGETKIELDRRRIRHRISRLKREIAEMAPTRRTKRAQRRANKVPSVVIVGYTNAGKSSVLNQLTGAGVLVENALFATLDPTVRRLELPDGRTGTIADTVGFVRQLPHQLVEAFRSTLEEVGDADLILHTVDGSHDDPVGQISAVNEVLADIPDIDQVRQLLVFNKLDLMSTDQQLELRSKYPEALFISAHTGAGLTELLDQVAELLIHPSVEVDVVIPYQRGDLVDQVHRFGEVQTVDHLEQGTHLVALVEPELAAALAEFAS